MKNIIILVFGLSTLIFASCKSDTTRGASSQVINIDSTKEILAAPDWSKDATIYELNIRQYTPEGTINAVIPYLKKVKDLGIDIIWVMPPYPIGVAKRKGKLGSPYSIKDYTAINPDMGTKEDFRKFVEEAHRLKMKVILDWVGNHTSFDNKWIKPHPDWYTKDSLGHITHPKGTDWTDVADLNYSNKEMRKAMIESMKYWVKEFDIDGYRCDVAGFVPNDFWSEAITKLQKLKHLFMLAEWEDPALHKAGFHMTYGWELHHMMNEIAKGKMKPLTLDTFFDKDFHRFPDEAYRMNFTTNHDENSWNGTIKERMGDAGDVMTVLAFTAEGMPLIYSGQEANLNKRLSFFDKDTIDWSDTSKLGFYKSLMHLHHQNRAVWNGKHGSYFQKINTSNPNIYAYLREKDGDEIVVFLNLSDKKQFFNILGLSKSDGYYKNIFTGEDKKFSEWIKQNKTLKPWGYLVIEKE